MYKNIPSHVANIKDFRLNIEMISNELENILNSDENSQADLLIELSAKIDEIIKILEISQEDRGFVCEFYSDIFMEIILITSALGPSSNSKYLEQIKKIKSVIKILNFAKEETLKIINKFNSLDDKSFA